MKFVAHDATPELRCVDVNRDYVITGGDGLDVYPTPLLSPEHVTLTPHHIDHPAIVSTVAIKPTNNSVVFGDNDGHLWFYDMDDADTAPRKLYPMVERSSRPQIVLIAWDPCGHIFAFSTDDAKVWIYDLMRQTIQELTTLDRTKEKPLIQRLLAFDPTENYLVTCGDDTMVYVYQWYTSVGNYKFRLVHKNTKLVNSVPLLCDQRRISWLPDGELVAIPLALKQQTTLISLMSLSQGWNHRVSLVGHGVGCAGAQFNPKVFTSAEPATGETIYFILASIDTNRNLAIWNTTKEKPISTLSEVFKSAAVDLAWHPDGQLLAVVSPEGKLGVAYFEPKELGVEVGPEVLKQLRSLHDEHVKPMDFKYSDAPPQRGKKAQAIEMVDQLQAIDVLKEKPESRSTEVVKDEKSSTPAAPTEEDKSPVFGEIVPEIPEVDTQIKSETPSTPPTTTAQPKRGKKRVTPITASATNQKVTTKDGKKRVKPTLISNGTSLALALVPAISSSIEQDLGTPKSLMELNKTSYGVSDAYAKQIKRSKQEEGTSKKLKRDLEPVKFIGLVMVNPTIAFSKVRLATPKVRLHIQVGTPNGTLEIRNGSGNETMPTRISFLKKERQVWCDFIPRYVQLVTTSDEFLAVATLDGQIIIYAQDLGRRILPPMMLGAPLVFFESQGPYLMAVTLVGELMVWDVTQKKIHLLTTLAPVLELSAKFQEDGLSKSDNITMCLVLEKGTPVVTLSNGAGYLYNTGMGVWQTVSELWWLFGSHYWDLNEDGDASAKKDGDKEGLILDLLEHRTNDEVIRKTRTGRGKYFNKINKNMMMKEGYEDLENSISISHLENRMLVSQLLGERKEFYKHFQTYCSRICELGLKTKLFEVCQRLLDTSTPQLTDKSNHDLLREVVELCSKHRDVQRILIHFAKKLELV